MLTRVLKSEIPTRGFWIVPLALLAIWIWIAAEQLVWFYWIPAAVFIAIAWLLCWLFFRWSTSHWTPELHPRRFWIGFHVALASFFLCVAFLYCWYHSYDTFTQAWEQRTMMTQTRIDWNAGLFFVARTRMPAGESFRTVGLEPWQHLSVNSGVIFNQTSVVTGLPWHGNTPTHPRAGFGYGTGIAKTFLPAGTHITAVMFPCWLPVLLTALLPIWWVLLLPRAMQRESRRARNLCATCGYDLRATPARCPECGTPI